MQADDSMSKVPAVTLAFWVIKVIATTLGETGGDAVSMTLNWGYALSSVLFIAVFVVAVAAQIAARRFHPFLYWGVIIATTTAGTTMADFADPFVGYRVFRRVADPVCVPDGVTWRLVLAGRVDRSGHGGLAEN